MFDADGTLLDTRELIRLGYVETMREYGYTAEAEVFSIATVSKPVHETYRDLFGDRAPVNVIADMAAHHEDLQNKSTDVIVAYEGLRQLLDTLKRRDIKAGLFTSGSVWHIRRNFKQAGFDVSTEFAAYSTSDDNVARKPAPDGLSLCLDRMGVPAANAIMVGDHAADILAGRAAGVYATVGLLHGLGSEDELRQAGADYLAPTLAELPSILDKIEL